MKAFSIKNQKQFMNQLLKSDLFDHFLLSEAIIRGAASYQIDGRINRAFFEEDELPSLVEPDSEYLPFSYLRPMLFSMIRGTHTPLYVKLVLLLSPANAAATIRHANTSISPEDINGIYLNLTFREGQLLLTSGVSYRNFTPDHSFDAAWDHLAARFLDLHDLDFDIR